MTFETEIAQFGQSAITLFDILLFAGILALVLLLCAVIFAWRAQAGLKRERDEVEQRTNDLELQLASLAGSLSGFATQAHGQQAQLQKVLNERLDQVSQRMGVGLTEQTQRTSQSLQQLHERLAVIDAAQANITALSGEMISLKDILANKQTRGAFGQGRMEAIIKDGLHSRAYEFQATLSNGTRPDCLVTLPDSRMKLVIDAKFPLEAYNALRSAPDELSQKAAEAQLRVDMNKHVKDISEKYLITGETNDSAIMFVPSESIYSELHERFEDVVQKAHRARVILASPNVLMLLVQTLQSMVKDASMREQTHLIKNEVIRLLEDVSRLKDRVGDLKKHFDQAHGDIDKITISADRIGKRGERIESLDLGEEAAAELSAQQRPKLMSV
jgi:DNA recombination protein RmuC